MIVLLVLLSWSELWQALTRPTSSHAATTRGVAQYSRGKYKESARAFAEAEQIRPTSAGAFNLGTAQVASGDRETGSTTLAKAMRDPRLRADALYNRGSSALAANAFDNAIRDLTETLRLRPNDAKAKRNLEIALLKKREQQQGGGGNQRNSGGGQPQPQQSNRAPAPGDKKGQQPQGDTDAEALLRAVQQQEQEELSRMRRVRPEPARVGW